MELIAQSGSMTLMPYAYQPIIDLQTGKIFGHEALMRPDGMGVLDFIDKIQKDDGTTDTHLLEVITFFSAVGKYDREGYLFINSFPNDFLSTKEQILLERIYGKEKLANIVIELLEYPEFDSVAWQRTKDFAERYGCLIAIDDFGTGLSTIEMVDLVNPDIVKVSREMIAQARSSENGFQELEDTIRYLSGEGYIVLTEGIETRTDLSNVKQLGASMAQGYYLGMPTMGEGEEEVVSI
jgi:EAL domain-containing protein (putative c-di-GMP-specific phosphodiesterase class I)